VLDLLSWRFTSGSSLDMRSFISDMPISIVVYDLGDASPQAPHLYVPSRHPHPMVWDSHKIFRPPFTPTITSSAQTNHTPGPSASATSSPRAWCRPTAPSRHGPPRPSRRPLPHASRSKPPAHGPPPRRAHLPSRRRPPPPTQLLRLRGPAGMRGGWAWRVWRRW
jgi:hypothetical protein